MSIVVASVGYFTAIVLADTADIARHLSAVPASGIALLLGLSLVNYSLRFFRWHGYIRRLGGDVPFTWHLLYYLASIGLTTTPAKAGEAVRAVYLKNHGIPYSRSFAALFAERVADVVAVALIAGLGLSKFGVHFKSVALLCAALILLILALWLLRARVPLPWLGTSTRPWIGRIAARCEEIFHCASELLSVRAVSAGTLVGLISWSAEAFALYLICVYLHLDVSVAVAMSIFALSMLIGAVSFLPGGLGTTEVAMGALLLSIGADASLAITATVLCRATTLWFGVAIGLGAIGLLESLRRGMFPATDIAPRA